MSTIKSPKEKKELSLHRDRRNTYGDNAKSSRKNIPKSKRLSHQSERQAANRPLMAAKGHVTEEVADQVELDSRNGAVAKHRVGFKKSPDQPLGLVLERKAKTSKVLRKSLRSST
jgi:hypothetical protein